MKNSKRLPVTVALPFEIHLINMGCKSNYIKHQGLVQYWRKGSKTMEINAFGVMNKPMYEEYLRFLNLYLKYGRKFMESLRSQLKVA